MDRCARSRGGDSLHLRLRQLRSSRFSEPVTGRTILPRSNLYQADVFDACLSRLGHVTVETKPQWGVMSAAQMLAHSAEVQEVMNGKPLEGSPWFIRLLAPLIRKAVVGSRPYPRGSRTHPQYVQREERDFDTEKARLLKALDDFRSARGTPVRHALFGVLTEAELGWACYKHLDHHLTQFGV